MRSLLFVPGHDARKMDKALSAGADALILDLEDAVPAQEKARARSLCADFLHAHHDRLPIFVRVNELDSGQVAADLAAVLPARPHGIILPKCQGPDDLTTLETWMTEAEQRYGLTAGTTHVLPIVTETAASIFELGNYAKYRSARLCGMLWGGEDLAADLGASSNRDASRAYLPTYQLVRSLTLLSATAAKVAAIDAVYANFRDLDGLKAESAQAVRDGFLGKAAIHPDQVGPINAAFTPSKDEIVAAQRVVAAFEAASTSGVATLDGKMIVKPYYLAAKRVLARVPQSAHRGAQENP